MLELDGEIHDRPALDHENQQASDHDLLLDRYRRLGDRFLEGVRGEFALRLIDPEKGLAIAARDGLGNRYLSYALNDRAFLTSRDDAALAEAVGAGRDYDRLRLAEFYSFGEISGPQTFFRGVSAVLPGEMVLVTAAGVERRRLSSPSLAERLELPRFEEYVELFAERLATAVARSLKGADRAAIMLSGGLDSTPIAAHAARILPPSNQRAALTALSWNVPGTAADERAFVEAAVATVGADLEWIDGSDAVPFSDLDRWPIHPATPEQTAFRWLHQRSYARAADLGHTRLLAGFGGDSLYGHARRWFWDLLANEGVGPAVDRLREIAERVGWPRALRSQLLGPLRPRRTSLRRTLPSWLTPDTQLLLLGRPRWPANLTTARRPRQAERLLALLDAHGANVERFYLEPFGLEQRTPLRDPDLVELALALPDRLLQQGAESRVVLRAAIRGLVPESVRKRSGKAIFSILVERGLAPDRLGWATEMVRSPDALWRGIVEPAAVERWLRGEFLDDSDRIGLLNALYGELWRLLRTSREPGSVRFDQ